jgi:hypothetical protein
LDSQFLTRYGLGHYVSCSQSEGRPLFSIRGNETDKMIAHARRLIEDIYPGDARVRII